MKVDAILWRRLDAAGHDACRLERRDDGWRLEGSATFLQEGAPACLSYALDCDGAWRTREGTVRGWVGDRKLEHRVARSSGGAWTLDGRAVPELAGLVDLDLGFTPATNLLQLRRLDLRIGQAADAPVAWLDVPAGTLSVLRQRYERRSRSEYAYEAPRFGYAAVLQVGPLGFVESYPGLWEAEG